MDLSKNYYYILGVPSNATDKEIKKSYYKLSFEYHPDKNKDIDPSKFNLITEAYDILMNSKTREEYDKKSKWGLNYDESYEFLNYEFDNISNGWDEEKYNKFKKEESLNVVVYIDDKFNGVVEYERWVTCKDCKGSGKDLRSKIEIKDKNGNIIKMFESEDGCDFCEGSGKDFMGQECSFCFGQGKIGSKDCKLCKGEKRILGNQKLTGIKIEENEKDHKIEFMGNFSKNIPGKVGHLWIVKK